jgi:hypothetical protein
MVVMRAMGSLSARVVEVADVPIAFRATDSERAQLVQQFLAGFPPAGGDAELAIRFGVRLPAMPARRPNHVVDGFEVWTAGSTMHVRLGDVARARADESTAVVGLVGESAARIVPAAFLFVGTHLLAHHDRFLVHGGAVVDNGRAYVVLGGTGAGKSTLVAATLGTEWQALADDMVVVRSEGSDVLVTGVPRPVAVPADVGAPPGAVPGVDDVRGRAFIGPAALASGWFPVQGLIEVGHGLSSAGDLAGLDAHRALRLLLASFTSVANPDLLRRFFGTAATLSRMPAWRLEHGADPGTRLTSARRLFTDVLAGPQPAP